MNVLIEHKRGLERVRKQIRHLLAILLMLLGGLVCLVLGVMKSAASVFQDFDNEVPELTLVMAELGLPLSVLLGGACLVIVPLLYLKRKANGPMIAALVLMLCLVIAGAVCLLCILEPIISISQVME